RDIVFALEASSSVASPAASATSSAAPAVITPGKSWLVPALLGVIALLVAAVALLFVRLNAPPAEPPSYRQLTFGREFISSARFRSEEHTSELQSLRHLVCRLLLEKKKNKK